MKTSTFLRNSVAIAAFSLVCSPLVKAQEIAHGSIFLQELEMRDNDAPSDPSKSNGHTNVKAVVIDNTTWAWISMNADECYAGIGSEDFACQLQCWNNTELVSNLGCPEDRDKTDIILQRYHQPDQSDSDPYYFAYAKKEGFVPVRMISPWVIMSGRWQFSAERHPFEITKANSADEYDLEAPVIESATVSMKGNVATFDFTASDDASEWFYVIEDESKGFKEVCFEMEHWEFAMPEAGDYTFKITPIDFSGHQGDAYIASTSGSVNIEKSEIASITVAPNPATDIITINGANIAKVELYTIDGKLAMTSVENTINVSTLSDGLYVVRIYTNDGTIITHKITVK